MTRFSLTRRPRLPPRFGSFLSTGILVRFLPAIAAIVLVAILSYRAHLDYVAGGQQVANSIKVIAQLHGLLATMKDAETGQRGFILTGEDRYIAPYMHASAVWEGKIAAVRALLSGNAEQERRLLALEHLCAEKFAELSRTIVLRRQGETAEAIALVRTGTGIELMDRIRAGAAEMAGDEGRNLVLRQDSWLTAVRWALIVLAGGNAFILAVLVATALRASRDYRSRGIQAWIRTGKIRLSEQILGEQSFEALAERVLVFIAEYLQARAGAVYLAEPGGGFRRLANFPSGSPDHAIHRNDDLLAQVAEENRALFVRDIPGEPAPTELLITPVSVDGVTHAIIQFVLSRRLETADHEFLSHALESLAVAMRSSKDRMRLMELLEGSRRQGDELQTQREQLSVSKFELQRANSHLNEQMQILKQQRLELSLFNSANFSCIATDAKGIIQIFNVGAERMLGYTAEEVLNKITPADLSDSQEIIARAKALNIELQTQIAPGFEPLIFKASKGIEDIYELTFIRKDGSRFPAVVSVTALRDAQESIIGYLLIGTDNTARKLAEEAAFKSEALQSAIFNSTNFSKIATDAKGVIQIFNVGAERMLGYTAEEVLNKITPADISDSQEIIARAQALSVELQTQIAPGFDALVFKASRGIEDIYELTYVRKDGSRLPAVVSVTALRDAEGVIIGYLLIGTDNTARKRAEEEAVKAGALQSAIFNSANFSSIATDAKGVI
jgi:CHASE3 domain sensor protein